MPTNAQLLAEIQTGALATQIAPLWSPVTDNTDASVAALLNLKNQPGYVQPRDVIVYLAENFKWGMVPYCYELGKMPDGTTAPFAVYSLFSILHLAAYGSVNPPLHLAIGPLTTAMGQLVTAGLITSADQTAIAAMEIKISRAEVVWGYDTEITQEQVSKVRTGVN